ncbi:MAG: L-histidine N(alpha)-methyltransferase, partial [Planctomycetaceae bacterium]
MNSPQLETLAPPKPRFLSDVLDGLNRAEKSLPCKYFYDERGSRLFERICELDEYYLTRTEIAILRRHDSEMAARLGARCAVIEYGSGSGVKTEILLDGLDRPAAYVPVEISGEHLRRAAADLARRFPRLR